MAYERVNWENLPSKKTPVNADNLNKMDEGIKDLETETDTKLNSKQDKLIAGTGIEITGTNIINNLNANYSTDEQVIGTWIDGKPLYRKAYDLTIDTTDSPVTYPLNIGSINVIKSYGYLDNQYNQRHILPDSSISFYFDNYSLFYNSKWAKGSGKFVVEYTKATD